ncbi:hypothetical protein DLJ53_26765 [Acuticoccus sediminis]|uniref:PepSY domain-containing protein n=1 Tax=Acuticoccus sediminis TaxID=2184697 RepID=A0A8B2NSF2_9HYPH|nr:PepSY domain-containing protein [Acuticoccus sediminis]RAH98312.1 hypothetical protein DLJ53_26765 [Acuticoccus sediminis]
MALIRTTIFAASFLALPSLVVAQTAAPAPATTPAATADATATTDGRIGIAAAIEAAKASVDGGILEAELENEGGEEIWEIDIATGETVQEVKVNAMTGAVISTDKKVIEGTWRSWFDKDSLTDSQRISGTLIEAVAKAETEAGGKITSLELDEEDGKLVYELEVDTADGEKDMTLDPATGMVTADD